MSSYRDTQTMSWWPPIREPTSTGTLSVLVTYDPISVPQATASGAKPTMRALVEYMIMAVLRFVSQVLGLTDQTSSSVTTARWTMSDRGLSRTSAMIAWYSPSLCVFSTKAPYAAQPLVSTMKLSASGLGPNACW